MYLPCQSRVSGAVVALRLAVLLPIGSTAVFEGEIHVSGDRRPHRTLGRESSGERWRELKPVPGSELEVALATSGALAKQHSLSQKMQAGSIMRRETSLSHSLIQGPGGYSTVPVQDRAVARDKAIEHENARNAGSNEPPVPLVASGDGTQEAGVNAEQEKEQEEREKNMGAKTDNADELGPVVIASDVATEDLVNPNITTLDKLAIDTVTKEVEAKKNEMEVEEKAEEQKALEKKDEEDAETAAYIVVGILSALVCFGGAAIIVIKTQSDDPAATENQPFSDMLRTKNQEGGVHFEDVDFDATHEHQDLEHLELPGEEAPPGESQLAADGEATGEPTL